MLLNNLKNSGNALEAFREAWNIHGLDSDDPHHGGYVRIPNILFRYLKELNIGAMQSNLCILLVYLISRDYNNRNGCSFPSHSLIAQDLNISVTSVERGLKKLNQAGLIEIERRMKGEAFISNNYSWNGLKEKLRKMLIRDKIIAE